MPDQEEDFFTARNPPRHFPVNPWDDLKFAGPIVGVVRPTKPGGFMFFPFRRHGKPQFSGGDGGGNNVGFLAARHKSGINIPTKTPKEKSSKTIQSRYSKFPRMGLQKGPKFLIQKPLFPTGNFSNRSDIKASVPAE